VAEADRMVEGVVESTMNIYHTAYLVVSEGPS
jgi:hypothetical protein